MGSATGVFGPYEEGAQSFADHVEQLARYVLSHEIPEVRQRALFLSSLGPKAYATLRCLTAPDRPADKSLSELMQILGDYLSPPPVKSTSTYRFRCRRQTEGEEVMEYAAHLRALAAQCNFGSSLERALCDQFVCGLICDDTRRLLLAVAHLTLDQAIDIAMACEASNKKAPSRAIAGELLADHATHSPRDTQQEACDSGGPLSHEGRDSLPLDSEAETDPAEMRSHDAATVAFADTTTAEVAADKPTEGKGDAAERTAAAMTRATTETVTVQMTGADVIKAAAEAAERGVEATSSSAPLAVPARQARTAAATATTAPASEMAAAKTAVAEPSDLDVESAERGAAVATSAPPATVPAELAAGEKARAMQADTASANGRRPHKLELRKVRARRRRQRSAVT